MSAESDLDHRTDPGACYRPPYRVPCGACQAWRDEQRCDLAYAVKPGEIRALSADGRAWFRATLANVAASDARMRQRKASTLAELCPTVAERNKRLAKWATGGDPRKRKSDAPMRPVGLTVEHAPDGATMTLLRPQPRDAQGNPRPPKAETHAVAAVYRWGESGELRLRVGAKASDVAAMGKALTGGKLPAARKGRGSRQTAVAPERTAVASEATTTPAPMPATQPKAPTGRDESPAPVSVAVEAVEARPGASTAVEVPATPPVRLTRMVALHGARQGRRLEEPVPLTVVKHRPDEWGFAVEAARAWLASRLEAEKRRPCDG